MTKIYVAAPWKNKADAKHTANQLRLAGYEVVSKWHDTTHNSNVYEAPPRVMFEEAQKDWADIQEATHLLFLNLGLSEGKAVELGIALQKGLTIHAIGGKERNVFLHMPQVNHVGGLTEYMDVVKSDHASKS